MAPKADFARVRKVGLMIPGLEEGKAWSGPCLKASKKIAACMATHKSAEPGTLAVVVGEDVRDELIEGDPHVYYVKERNSRISQIERSGSISATTRRLFTINGSPTRCYTYCGSYLRRSN